MSSPRSFSPSSACVWRWSGTYLVATQGSYLRMIVYAAVGGATVNDDMLQVRIALQQDRTNGLFDELS
jgi:hypothetical protein